MTLAPLREAADSMAKASTPEPFSSSRTSNWVARAGGLPDYIQHIAHDLMEKRGKSESNAIQMAVGIVKRWCRGGGNVDAGTKAAACKATSEWEAKKAGAHAKGAVQHSELDKWRMPSLADELAVRDAALERLIVFEQALGQEGMVALLAEGMLAEADPQDDDGKLVLLAEGLRFDLMTVSGRDIPPLRRVQEARRRDPFDLVVFALALSEDFNPGEVRDFHGRWRVGGPHHAHLTPLASAPRLTRLTSASHSDAQRRYEGGVRRMSPATRASLLNVFTQTERVAPKGRQPTSDLDELYKLAETHHPQFAAVLRDIGKRLGATVHERGSTAMGTALEGAGAHRAHVLVNSLKGRKRATEKVAGKYEGDASRLNDVVRGAVAVPHVDDLAGAIRAVRESLPKGWTLTAPENRFVSGRRGDNVNTGDLNGYRDIAVILRSPEGFNMELQITTTHMLNAKNAGHEMYERRRRILENGQTAVLPVDLAHQVRKIDRQAKELYSAAMVRSSSVRRPSAR